MKFEQKLALNWRKIRCNRSIDLFDSSVVSFTWTSHRSNKIKFTLAINKLTHLATDQMIQLFIGCTAGDCTFLLIACYFCNHHFQHRFEGKKIISPFVRYCNMAGVSGFFFPLAMLSYSFSPASFCLSLGKKKTFSINTHIDFPVNARWSTFAFRRLISISNM